MNVSLYQAAAALTANSQWEDVVSENLTNGNVPGYRKLALTTAAVQAGLMPGNGGQDHFTLPESTVTTSFKHGELDYTGQPMNVAIEGDGFFQVQLDNGTTAVSRDGEFRTNSKGQLTTKEGYMVMGQNGPIQLDPANHGNITFSSEGNVAQGGVVKGKLELTDYTNPQLLTQTGGVYFLATDPKLEAQPATGTLRQNFVESSNTSSLSEMANMLTAMRTFEANQHVVQTQDDRLGKVISDLGNPSS